MKEFAFLQLPKGYSLYRTIALEKDRKALWFMMIGQLVIAGVMIFLGYINCPVTEAFSMEILQIITAFLAMLIGMFVYILGHEWVHGVFIRLFSGSPAKFGFRRGMAYAGSDAYFCKTAYIVIALAPVLIWGLILGLLLDDVPTQYFWYLYAIQIFNFAGAVGDFYVTGVILGLPGGVLVTDEGTEMRFYVRKG